MKKAKKLTPKIEMTADSYINQGYQTLFNYEIKETGGFDWHGHPPANLVLSAYGLLEFTDMAKVFDIDTRVIDRAQKFILSKQKQDGSWEPESRTTWSVKGITGNLIVTAYVTWALAESGSKGTALDKAIDWLKKNWKDSEKDLYGLSLVANAFVAWNPKDDSTFEVLKKLDSMKKEDTIDNAGVVYWQGGQTLYYAKGQSADIESTALAVYALRKSGEFMTTVQQGLNYLMKTKQSNGTWGSTQATILAFKALLGGSAGDEQTEVVEVKATLNGETQAIKITPDQSDVMQLLDLKSNTKKGDNKMKIEVKGKSNMMYQVVTRYYLPWTDIKSEIKPVEISVKYDRTSLKIDDTLKVNVKVEYNGPTSTFMVIIRLGIAPGFTVEASDFGDLLSQKKIDRYELTARQVSVYLGAMSPGDTFEFTYQLKAKYPVKAKAPKSEVYEYYTPTNRAETKPVELEILQK